MSRTPDRRLPYPGLRPFTQEESDLFFGRDGCVDSMVDRLAETRFLAVVGPSGSGKSSLVRTGLLEALELGLYPSAGSYWQVADLHPGRTPLRNLAAALLTTRESAAGQDLDYLAGFLRHGPRSIVEWAEGGNLEEGANLLILVDQFEELFRYGDYAQREEAEAFVGLLLESASAPEARMHVVITMRSEYLGAGTLMPGLAERVNQGLYLTPRMDREGCRAAIEGPSGVIGFELSPRLVNRLLNDLASFAPWEAEGRSTQLDEVSRRADQLPLMQHVLNRLWVRAAAEAESGTVRLGLGDYERIGGLRGALNAHGAAVMAKLGPEREGLVEAVFRALVDGPSRGLAVRRPCRLGELVEVTGGSRDEVVAVVEAFRARDCNFLRTSEPALDEDVVVDISHESLIRQWSRLGEWLEEEMHDKGAWQRLVAAQEHHSRGEGGLLRGLDLQTLSSWWDSVQPTAEWATRHGGDYGSSLRFLEESRRAEALRVAEQHRRETRERNRLRIGVAALTVALAVVTSLSVLAWNLKEDAQRLAEKEQRNVASYLETLEEIGNVLYSDRYVSMLGMAPLQSELMEKLIPYQSELERQYAAAVDPASIIRNKYRFGEALNSIGKARGAMSNYQEAYERGRDVLEVRSADEPAPEGVLAGFLDAGTIFAWYLFDAGAANEAVEVMETMRLHVRDPDPTNLSIPMAIAHANFQNLESRYDWERDREEEAEEHLRKATTLLRPVVESPDATMETLALQTVLYGNFEGDASDVVEKQCALAARMMDENPMDRRTVRARVACLKSRAWESGVAGDREAALRLLETASEYLTVVSRLIPSDQGVAVYRAEIERRLSVLKTRDERHPHALRASKHFVQALNGRTLLQDQTKRVENLYRGFVEVADEALQLRQAADAPDPRIEFYEGLIRAVDPTIQAFPHAPSFAFVAADANRRIAEVLLANPERRADAEGYLEGALSLFAKAGIFDDLSRFTEDFAAYCSAYESRIELYAEGGRIDEAVRDLEAMNETCLPALERYPWDFYLRYRLLRSSALVGEALFEAERFEAALPYLEYGSRRGVRGSTELLARAYREGHGVAPEPEQAGRFAELERRQSVKRLRIPTEFGGVTADFDVFLRDSPPEYGFEGIDDQVEWVEEARGGKVPPEVAESLRELQQMARVWGVSFGDVSVFALGKAAEMRGGVPIDGSTYDLRGAVTLMSRGSLRKILDVLRNDSRLEERVVTLGGGLLDRGVKPDMALIARIREIERRIAQEILEERMNERESEDS